MKQFLCIWGAGYIDMTSGRGATIEVHTLDWFTEDLGYRIDYLKVINDLEIGESFNVPDVTSIHSVVRVQ